MDDLPRIGIGVILIKEDKVLILKRKNSHGNGDWAFPGGNLEFKESPEEGAIREVMEETGIKIDKAEFLTITNDIFEKEGKHYITLFMKAYFDTSQEPKNLEPNKCEELGWFSWNDLPNPLFTPFKNLLNKGFNPLNLNLK